MDNSNWSPEYLEKPFDPDLCDRLKKAASALRTHGVPRPDLEAEIALTVEMAEAQGYTPNHDTVRKYAECLIAGWDQGGSKDKGSVLPWVFGTAAVVGLVAVLVGKVR